MRWLYERNRWLIFPLYGMFPVKIITHIGKPIPYDPDVTAEKLAEKVSVFYYKGIKYTFRFTLCS